MSCNELNDIFIDVADYRPIAATAHEAALSHVALCSECAAKLSALRSVNASLLAAADAEREHAPAAVKTSLLAAFNAQHAQPASNVVAFPKRKSPLWIATAVAAVLLLAIAIPIWINLKQRSSQPAVASQNSQPVAPVVENHPADVVQPGAGINSRPTNASRVKRAKPVRPTARVQNQTAAKTENEFLPLTYLNDATAIDSGTIVRLKLSKAALLSLGLPVNAERSGDTVRADVVLGDDGVARAIRLVD